MATKSAPKTALVDAAPADADAAALTATDQAAADAAAIEQEAAEIAAAAEQQAAAAAAEAAQLAADQAAAAAVDAAAGPRRYRVLSPLSHDGFELGIGDVVELSERQAASLVGHTVEPS